MNVEKIGGLNFDKLYKILNLSNITDAQKIKFVSSNKFEINNIVEKSISDVDFNWLMQNRALKKFRPLKNSYTKRGDKLLLAQALNIPASDVPKYIRNVTDILKNATKLSQIEQVSINKLRSYVYRHGNQDELVAFFDNELANSNNIKNSLDKNLEYENGGIADYFVRPIHRMKNKTFIALVNTIDKYVNKFVENGFLTQKEADELSKYSLIRVYQLWQNSKLINAIKI